MPQKTQEEKLALKAKRACSIDLYNADDDWRHLATQINVLKTTAYRWLREGVKDDGRGGSYNQKITAEQIKFPFSLLLFPFIGLRNIIIAFLYFLLFYNDFLLFGKMYVFIQYSSFYCKKL